MSYPYSFLTSIPPTGDGDWGPDLEATLKEIADHIDIEHNPDGSHKAGVTASEWKAVAGAVTWLSTTSFKLPESDEFEIGRKVFVNQSVDVIGEVASASTAAGETTVALENIVLYSDNSNSSTLTDPISSVSVSLVTPRSAVSKDFAGLADTPASYSGQGGKSVAVKGDATGLEFVDAFPAGVLAPFAGSSAPSGWLLCYGQAVSRTTYAALFAIIGTTFGVGDGSTTFNLPDLRGRGVIGLDNMGGASANRVTAAQADSLGGASGAENHTLTTGEMPAHTHDEYTYVGGGGSNGVQNNNSSQVAGTLSVQDTGSAGSGGAHNNMAPYVALNYIIKA